MTTNITIHQTTNVVTPPAPAVHPTARHLAAAALVALGLALPSAALAQMPPDIAAKVAALGRVVDPESTGKIYAALQEKEPYAGIKVVRDVKYGTHPRQVVDIFTPETGAAGRPVLMFVHGGGYVRGNKRPPGSPFYENVMVFAARHGMVGVNVEYRLAPEFKWPSGPEDMGAAVRFVNENIANYGGDPARVFLMGHSAGAGHVAAYVSHPEFFGPKGSGLAGAIFSSGPSYQLKAEPTDIDRRLFRRRYRALRRACRPAGPHQDQDSVHDVAGRTRSARDRRSVRKPQGRAVQVRARLRPQHHASASQPHVGILRHQHRGHPAFGPILEFIKTGK